MCNMTHLVVRDDSFMFVMWLIHVCAMTHPCMCHDSFGRGKQWTQAGDNVLKNEKEIGTRQKGKKIEKHLQCVAELFVAVFCSMCSCDTVCCSLLQFVAACRM